MDPGRGVKLTTHFHLMLRFRMLGAVPSLLEYVFMASCLAKHRGNFTASFKAHYAPTGVFAAIVRCLTLLV